MLEQGEASAFVLDRVLLRRYAQLKTATPQAEEISEPQEAPIIIAGFGRYGQIVSRVLLAQGIPTTVLDHSVDMLEVARTFGYRVFYGDATRLDLLRVAGADKARVLVGKPPVPIASALRALSTRRPPLTLTRESEDR